MFCPFYSPFPFRFTFTFVCWPCAKHRKNKSSGLASHTWPVSHSISSFSGLRCHNCLSLVRQTPALLSLRFPLKIVSFLLSKFSRLSISLAPSFSSLGSAPRWEDLAVNLMLAPRPPNTVRLALYRILSEIIQAAIEIMWRPPVARFLLFLYSFVQLIV